MKISKIPGLGRFGVFIDDLDLSPQKMSDEEWMSIGDIHTNSLVTILRNVKVSFQDYHNRIWQWGTPRSVSFQNFCAKYKIESQEQFNTFSLKEEINGVKIDEKDRQWFKMIEKCTAIDEMNGEFTSLMRVSGIKDEEGDATGMFAEGELLWHSNESGNIFFSPGVSLLGHRGMVGSSTGFVTTVDWYEEQTESFRSELDEMILVHKFTPGKINPGLRAEQDVIMHRNMCPIDDVEIPLVIQSPKGFKGLHYSVNTINSIKGVTEKESQKIFEHINSTLFTEKNMYDHWYQQDNDLCLFDNSITLHRRLGGVADRLAYRIQYDYRHISDFHWNPYFQEPYKNQHKEKLKDSEIFLNKMKMVLY